MNLKRFKEYSSKNPDDGFTLMELLISMSIMSIIGVVVVASFFTVINLIRVIPASVKLTQGFISLDSAARRFVSRVKPTYWEPHFNYELDSDSIILPFFEGTAGKYLQIELKDNMLCIETFEEANMEEVATLFTTGPFSYLEIEMITTSEEGLIGIEFTLKPEHEKIDEFKIFTRFGGYIFEAEK